MPAVGLIGLGAGAVALYFRAGLAEAIINRLNGRYVNSSVWQATNSRIEDRLFAMETRLKTLEDKVDHGFESLRSSIRT